MGLAIKKHLRRKRLYVCMAGMLFMLFGLVVLLATPDRNVRRSLPDTSELRDAVQEGLVSLDVLLEVQDEGSALVTERMVLRRKLKALNGYCRSLPDKFKEGNAVRYDIFSATKDKEPIYSTGVTSVSSMPEIVHGDNNLIVCVGEEGRSLSRGDHELTLIYAIRDFVDSKNSTKSFTWSLDELGAASFTLQLALPSSVTPDKLTQLQYSLGPTGTVYGSPIAPIGELPGSKPFTLLLPKIGDHSQKIVVASNESIRNSDQFNLNVSWPNSQHLAHGY